MDLAKKISNMVELLWGVDLGTYLVLISNPLVLSLFMWITVSDVWFGICFEDSSLFDPMRA